MGFILIAFWSAASIPIIIKLATVVGRYYAMDRDKRWERVKVAVDALTTGKGELSYTHHLYGAVFALRVDLRGVAL